MIMTAKAYTTRSTHVRSVACLYRAMMRCLRHHITRTTYAINAVLKVIDAVKWIFPVSYTHLYISVDTHFLFTLFYVF